MSMQKKYSHRMSLDPKDLVLVFKHVNVNANCNPAKFTEDDNKNIKHIIS